MSDIVFASIAPHPPILLSSMGSEEDRERVKSTIQNLNALGEKLNEISPQKILISSPHPDWGFNVPLSFLTEEFRGEVITYLTGAEDPEEHFQKGKETYELEIKNKERVALIASGDLSHRLKDEGPYKYHPDGEKFDKELVRSLEDKDIKNILELDRKYPEAGECGLRSFSFLLGILERRVEVEEKNYRPRILSHEGPFGVGYLVAEFEL